MKLDEVVAELCLRYDVPLNFLRRVDPRFVNKGTGRVDCRSEQRASLNSLAPFQYHWTAAQVHDGCDAVGEIKRRITKVISCGHHRTSGHMNMRIRQTRHEVFSGAVYGDRIGRHLNLRSASNFGNALAAHQYGPTL